MKSLSLTRSPDNRTCRAAETRPWQAQCDERVNAQNRPLSNRGSRYRCGTLFSCAIVSFGIYIHGARHISILHSDQLEFESTTTRRFNIRACALLLQRRRRAQAVERIGTLLLARRAVARCVILRRYFSRHGFVTRAEHRYSRSNEEYVVRLDREAHCHAVNVDHYKD
jgi:hypothetical protein